MTLSDLLRDVRMSFAPAPQPSFGNLDNATSMALTAAILQAVPFLWMVSILGVDDPHAPRFDPLKPTLRSGRKAQARFMVPAKPSKRAHQYEEMDSSVIWTWQQLAQMLEGLDQRQANNLLEELALAAFGDDLIRVGFHGQSAAVNTDPIANPNGEDVMMGWPALAKAADPEGLRVLRDAVTFSTSGKGDFTDLDSMVYALIKKLPEAYRQDPRLVVMVGGDLLRAHQKAHLKAGQVRDKTQRMKIADLGFVSHQHMPSTYLAITLVENLQVLTVNHTHRLTAGDVDDLASWGIRYNRAQSYALGEPTAYAAFDAITLATEE
ncbi:P2 family phage major capsid protein [Aeromonas jandaei]|uniref:P2 family phage major capsid protein n=1 Tax=Aeromonas jandaei TaxID=650 RepID=UPI001F372868|nr:P2 family phage major capsid protein [Aeromonas jandaei]MCF7717920.1 P2 family phage major capsid protein [Aeromonas jandaei]